MKSSMAYSRGKQTHHSMGMNPNLNVEDEYVENLLKQIQFLSLETKLIKENHSQSKGAGIMALIDKENLPVVDHLLASADKYKQMRNQLSAQSNDLMFQNWELEAEERGLMRKREYHDGRRKQIQKQNLQSKDHTELLLKQLGQKTLMAKGKMENTIRLNDNLKKSIKDKKVQLEKLLQQDLIGGILGLALTAKSDSEYLTEQEDLKAKDLTIAGLKADIVLHHYIQKLYEQELSKNLRYIELVEERKQLENSLQDQQKSLSGLQFKLIEVETTTRLAQTEKEKEIKERRTIQEELFNSKQLLEEVLKSNELKVEKRRSERVKNSGELKKMDLMVSRLENQLEEGRQKAAKAEEVCNRYRIERKANEEQLLRFTSQIATLKEALSKLTSSNSQMEVESTGRAKELDTLHRELTNLKKEHMKLSTALCEVEENYTEQAERHEFYEGCSRLKEELKSVRVEELCGVVEDNLDVNKTVGSLISKWKEIQNFSRI